MAQPTVPEIIDIAAVSQMLAANAIYKRGLFGGGIDRRLPRLLYMERSAVEYIYGLDPTEENLRNTANYVYALCGEFGLRASYLINSSTGGSVAGITDSSSSQEVWNNIVVTSADFADATNYNNSDLVGVAVRIFANDINQRYLIQGTEWNYTANGIEILIDGFDSTAYDYTFNIWYVRRTNLATVSEGFSPIDYIAAGAETELVYTQLIGMTVTLVMRDGIGYRVITTGTPTPTQVLFDTTTGTVTFNSGSPLSADEWIHIS
jgi:hypothetical protein